MIVTDTLDRRRTYVQAQIDAIAKRFPGNCRVFSIDGRAGEMRGTEVVGDTVFILIALDNGGFVSELPGMWQGGMIL